MVCPVVALYLNVFVAVVQAFLKVPALKELAPPQKEPPFLVAQLIVMAIFVVLAVVAVKKFRRDRVVAARSERISVCRFGTPCGMGEASAAAQG